MEKLVNFKVRHKMEAARTLLIKYTKEKPEVISTPVAEDPVSHGGGGAKVSQTKREPIKLLKFSKVEKDHQAFLQFLIWSQN